jgi:hypothetical protein
MHYSEGERHVYLKQLAKEYLQSLGFTPEQITEDYKLQIGESILELDVVAENNKESIVIEVGQTQAEHLQLLKFYFTKVIHIPYGTLILTEERLKLEMEKKLVEELKQQATTDPKKIQNDIELKIIKMYQDKCNSCKNKRNRPRLFRNKRKW